MVYDDLMIRNNTVPYYKQNRSQPVTVQCINTGVGAPVDRRQLKLNYIPSNSNRMLYSIFGIVLICTQDVTDFILTLSYNVQLTGRYFIIGSNRVYNYSLHLLC